MKTIVKANTVSIEKNAQPWTHFLENRKENQNQAAEKRKTRLWKRKPL